MSRGGSRRDENRNDVPPGDLRPGGGGDEPSVGPGDVIGGRYVLRDVIGAGGMGTVWRAEQLVLARTVAVKILKPHYAHQPEMVERFQKEARAASRINHPNTVAVIDFGETEGGLLYLVMEYVRGQTLADVIARELPLPPRRLAAIFTQILGALEEAHAVGVIHRDLKPDNILIERMRGGVDVVKVCDFGLATLGGDGAGPSAIVCGTPEYMSPEQARGLALDGRSDLYAAGIVLYEALTGEVPFTGRSMQEVMQRQVLDAPVPPRARRPDLPIDPLLEAAALQALAKEPDARFAGADEFRQTLEDVAATRVAGTGRCAACGGSAPAGATFCPGCGSRIGVGMGVAFGSRPSVVLVKAQQTAPSRAPFVGRDAELATLGTLVARPAGRSVIVRGAVGVGRTRLVQEALARSAAASGGPRHLVIGPDPTGAGEALQPIRRAVAGALGLDLRPGVEELDDAVAATGEEPRDVGRGLRELFGIAPADGGLELAVRRRECVTAAVAILRGGWASPPTVLIFDDVDRFDHASREVLRRLVASPAPGATAVVVVTTSEDASDWQPDEWLDLGPLAVAEATALARALGEDPDAAAALARLGGGMPLYLEQAVLAALESEAARGKTLSDLVAARIQTLAPVGRRALQIASVVGRKVPRTVLGALLERGEEAVAVALLESSGFAVADETTLRFRHPLFADVAYDGIPQAARRELHRRLYGFLAGSNTSPLVLGLHGHAGDVGAEAIPILLEAGEACQQRFDDRGAIHHFRRAWELARWAILRGDVDDPSVLGRVSLRLGEAMYWAGQSSAAQWILMEGLEHAGNDGALEASLHRALARAALALGRTSPAIESLRRALARAFKAGARDLVAELYLDLATILARSGDRAAALGELDEALFLCASERDGGPVIWRLLLKKAELEGEQGEGLAASATAAMALREAERQGSALGRGRAHELLADLEARAGRPDAASEHRLRAVTALRDLGDRRTTARLLLDEGAEDLRRGAVARARMRIELAAGLARAVDWAEGVGRSQAMLAAVSVGA